MARKTYIEVKVRLIIRADEDFVDMGQIIDEMDYDFSSNTEGADIEDTEIMDYEVTDSK